MTKNNNISDSKFIDSINTLKKDLKFENQIHDNNIYLRGIAKSFETCLEYTWKHLKRQVQDHGVDIYSPKDTIKAAGRIGLIDNVEKWLGFLEDRNYAVHDYLGMSDEEYLETIKDFYKEVTKLIA